MSSRNMMTAKPGSCPQKFPEAFDVASRAESVTQFRHCAMIQLPFLQNAILVIETPLYVYANAVPTIRA